MKFEDIIYRMLIFPRGKKYWHWRYYGFGYKVQDCGDEYRILCQSKEIRAKKILRPQKQMPLHIVCSGPSVGKYKSVEKLWSVDSFVMNGSHAIYQGNERVFSYYLVSDIGYIQRQWHSFLYGLKKTRFLVVDHRVLKEIILKDSNALEGVEIMLFDGLERPYKRPLDKPLNKPEESVFCEGDRVFSCNEEYGFSPSKTVAYLALELAIAMGFSDITYFGLDLGGKRFYEEKSPEKTMINEDFEEYILPDFILASRVCAQLGVVVKNASRDSRLSSRIFPKVIV